MTTLRYNYRIYPTTSQRIALARVFGCTRVVWNEALAKAEEGGYKGFAQASRDLTQLKKTEGRLWLAEVSCVPLQQSIGNLDTSFQRFFKGLKGKGPKSGFPKFKSKYSEQSARYTKRGFSLRNGKLVLAKLGKVRVKWSRALPSDPKTATVTLDASGRYHVSFVVQKVDVPYVGGTHVGIDLGIKTFATLSTGEFVHGPAYAPLERRLARAQRLLSRKVKGSNRRARARTRVAKIHAKVSDLRRDFLAKLSTRLVKEHHSLFVEDLNVRGMVKNHSLARAISRQGWSKFRTLLVEKCDRYERKLVVISRWEPTSQVCSSCGFRWGKLNLKIRELVCSSCGTRHDRDVNAALNIVAAGLAETQNGRGEIVRLTEPLVRSAELCEASTAQCLA